MDRTIIVSGSYDGTIAIWDVVTERVIKSPAVPQGQIPLRLAISQDKTELAAALTSRVLLYNLGHGRIPVKANFDGFRGNVMSVGFQKQGKWLYCCSQDGTVRILDTRKSGLAKSYKEKNPITAVALSHGETQILAGDRTGVIRCYDLTADKPKQEIVLKKAITSIILTRQDRLMIVAEAEGDLSVHKHRESLLVPTKIYNAHKDYLVRAVLSPDQKLIATCSADRTARIFSLAEDGKIELKKTLAGHTRWVWDACFSAVSDCLVTASSDFTIKLWNVQFGQDRKVLKGHHRMAVTCIALDDRSS